MPEQFSSDLSSSRSTRGTSLFESLVALAIVATLGVIMAPSVENLGLHRQGSLALQRVASSIYRARTTAAKSGVVAMLCPSADGNQCGGNWHDGILVFPDRNGNLLHDPDESPVDYVGFENLRGTLHWRAFQSKPYLQITPLGFTRYQNGNFTWCDPDKSSSGAHQLILNRTGRVRFAVDSDGDGNRENSQGLPISCPK